MKSRRKCPPEMWQWTCSDIRPRTFFHSATTSSRCSRLYHPCSCALLMVWETASVRLAVTSLCVSVYVRGSGGGAGCFAASSSRRNTTFSFEASKIAGPNSLAVWNRNRSPADSSAHDARSPPKKKQQRKVAIKRWVRNICAYRHDVSPPRRVLRPAPEHDLQCARGVVLLLELVDREQGHGSGRSHVLASLFPWSELEVGGKPGPGKAAGSSSEGG
jgi:hypothetical protein